MKQSLFARALLSLLGIILILWGVSQIALGVIGEPATAVITHIRREGAERAETVPNRYTYNISYTFTLPEGKEIHGFSKKIGNAVYLKADGTSTVRVRYFTAFPYINVMERETRLGAGQVVLVITGGFLIFYMNRKKRDRDT